MKKLITLAIVISALLCTCGFTKANVTVEPLRTNRQGELHALANMARDMGLPEDSPIITEAQRLWLEEEQNLRILAKVVRNEAGYCSDRHQQLVAQVVLNRVESPLFPDNIVDVVNAPLQYNPAYTRNLPVYGGSDEETNRAFENALKAMNGEVDCPTNVVYQSEFPKLGSGSYEIHKVDTGWFASTTYFNFV